MHLREESFFHTFRFKICASIEANGQDETRTTSRRANAIWVGVGTPQKAGALVHYWLTRVWISNFKLFFLLNGAFNLDSVWTIISMRIFLTICDPIWLYVLLFFNFNILGVLAQHFGYIVSTYLHKMLNHTWSIVEFCILKYWNNIYYSTFTYFLLLKKGKLKTTSRTSGSWENKWEKTVTLVPTTQGSARGRAPAVLRALLVYHHAHALPSVCVGIWKYLDGPRTREKKKLWAYGGS